MRTEPKVYFAGPLFTDAQRLFNERAADELRRQGLAVFLPQSLQQDASEADWQSKVFKCNCAEIEAADVIIAVVGGCPVDDGTSWEIGYAYARGKPVVGIHTDTRTVGKEGTVNLMVEQACRAILPGDWKEVADTAKR